MHGHCISLPAYEKKSGFDCPGSEGLEAGLIDQLFQGSHAKLPGASPDRFLVIKIVVEVACKKRPFQLFQQFMLCSSIEIVILSECI